MEETYKDNPQVEDGNKKQDCGCNDGNCNAPKKNIYSKIIFAVVLVAAMAIIGVKITGRPGNISVKQSIAAPGKITGSDTTKTKSCDTSKGSSCCPKK
jgi:hypothetical protein